MHFLTAVPNICEKNNEPSALIVRPMLIAALLAAAGTVAGLKGVRADMRVIAFLTAGFILSEIIARTSCPLRPALVCAGIFFIFFMRAGIESMRFNTEESREFFSSYEVTVPGQFDYASYLKGIGIGSKEAYDAYMDGETGEGIIAKTRSYIASKLHQYMGEDDESVYRAILIGDKSELSDELKSLYQSAGISHLLAISGLHVSIIGGGLFSFLKDKLKFSRAHASISASLFLCFYAALCSMTSSVIRASVMLSLSFLAAVRMRSYDMRSAAALSLMVILLIHPYQILLSGFQLSFAAVWAIAYLSAEMVRGIELRIKLKRHITGRYTCAADRLPAAARVIVMNFSIQLALLPVLAWHYFTFPLYGFFLNFLVIPLMGTVLLSGVVLIGLAALSDLAGLFSPALMRLIGIPAYISAAPGHYILKFYSRLAELSAAFPGSRILTGRPSLYLIIAYLALILLIVRLLNRPGILNPGGNQYLLIAALLSALIINASLLKYYEPRAFYVMALDAGQGDSFVIKSGDIYISIDGGSSSNLKFGERALEPFLMSHRIRDIDMAIISHADSDHTSGIEYILESSDQVSVESLYLPAAAKTSADYDSLKTLFISGGGDPAMINYLSDLTPIMTGRDISLVTIYAGNAASSDTNRQSDVVLLEKGNDFSMLFTGDAGTEDEEEIIKLYETAAKSALIRGGGVSVLKAGHHGSKTSSSEAFLKALSPEVALLSFGEGNPYGHPHEEVLRRLYQQGIATVSTAENGSLLITEDGISPAR